MCAACAETDRVREMHARWASRTRTSRQDLHPACALPGIHRRRVTWSQAPRAQTTRLTQTAQCLSCASQPSGRWPAGRQGASKQTVVHVGKSQHSRKLPTYRQCRSETRCRHHRLTQAAATTFRTHTTVMRIGSPITHFACHDLQIDLLLFHLQSSHCRRMLHHSMLFDCGAVCTTWAQVVLPTRPALVCSTPHHLLDVCLGLP